MKVYETRHKPASDYKICVRRQCDLCKVDSKSEEWGGGTYEVNDTQLTVTALCKTSKPYSGTEYEIDLCPACFKDKLVPWLQSQGADIKAKGWHW